MNKALEPIATLRLILSLAVKIKNMNDRQKLLFTEYESLGEDEIHLRLNSSAYDPSQRVFMQTWLNIKESKRNLDLQKKTTWIFRLTVAIVILTLILVALAILPYKPLDMYPHKYTTQPEAKNQPDQKRMHEPRDKIQK